MERKTEVWIQIFGREKICVNIFFFIFLNSLSSISGNFDDTYPDDIIKKFVELIRKLDNSDTIVENLFIEILTKFSILSEDEQTDPQ